AGIAGISRISVPLVHLRLHPPGRRHEAPPCKIRRVSWLFLLLTALRPPASPARPGATAADPAGAPPPLPPPPSAAETARLVAGEVLLASRPVAAPRALAEEVGQGIINAPSERVFAAVVDFAHYQEWVPFVK